MLWRKRFFVQHSGLGQYQLAIDDYTMAIQLEPSGLRYNNRAWAYYYLGETTKMEADDAAACSLDSFYCSD
jgi:tetratricopeptide (TPR) repeat protein